MAIDDAKNYTLTGEQIKELPSRIDAAKGFARTLSGADYNWNSVSNNTNEPLDSVAIWRLPPGMYVAPVGLNVKILNNQNASTGILYVVGGPSSFGATVLELSNVLYSTIGWETGTAYIISSVGSATYTFHMGSVIDGLNGEPYTTRPLSAKQGYVLSRMIGDLTNLTTTSQTSTVSAINEINSQLGFAKVLTEDDFNWNSTTRSDTEPYNAIALWKLPAGLYSTGDLVLSNKVIWIRNDSFGYLTEAYTILVCNKDNQGYIPILYVLRDSFVTGNYLIGGTTVSTTGSLHAGYNLLDTYSIVNNLTDTSERKPLSARQGYILGNRIRAMADSAPATNTAGEPGNLMPVLLNGTAHLYMCTEKNWVVNPDTQQGGHWEYTWVQMV